MSIHLDPDTTRELTKVLDVLVMADKHFTAEAQMNAALHMAAEVRPAPLAAAISNARATVASLIRDERTEQVEFRE